MPSHPQGGGVTAIQHSDAYGLFAATSSFNYPQVPGGINRSTDDGNSWQNLFAVYNARTLYIDDLVQFYASIQEDPGSNEGIYKSMNGGTIWNMVFDAGVNNNVFCIAATSGNYYAGTRTGVLFSTDGNTWDYDASFPSGNGWVRDIEIMQDGTPIVASDGGVYYKDLSNWVKVPGVNPADTISAIGLNESLFNKNTSLDYELFLGALSGNIFSGTLADVFLLCALFHEISEFMLRGGLSIVGVLSLSSNQGGAYNASNCLPLNEGFPTARPLRAFSYKEFLSERTVYAGLALDNMDGAKVYTRVFITSVEADNSEIPKSFKLEQNYPNPFNPVTNIEYSIPEASFVQLNVYDVLGNEVASLVNEEQSAGTYRTDFLGSSLASGLYIARLKAGVFSTTIKMSLLK